MITSPILQRALLDVAFAFWNENKQSGKKLLNFLKCVQINV